MNINSYVGKKIKMYYASPQGEVFDIGLVKSSNNNAAITLLKEGTKELVRSVCIEYPR